MTKVLIFGANGRVGKKLFSTFYRDDKFDVATSVRADCDLTDASAIEATIDMHRPQVIINAAACNGPEVCADNPRRAFAINAQAPLVMAVAAKQRGALFVHYSTDYVFSDSLQTLDESCRPSPVNLYGASKLAGERAIYAVDPYHLVFRLSSVYADDLSGPLDPIKQHNRGAGTAENPIKVLKQLCTPISARLAAYLTRHAVEVTLKGSLRARSGLYHMTPGAAVWKVDFAQAVMEIYAPSPQAPHIVEGTLREPRPTALGLSGAKFCNTFNIDPWSPFADLRETLTEIMAVPPKSIGYVQ